MNRWRCFARTLILFSLLGTALTASAASIAYGLGLLPDPSGEVVQVGAWAIGIILAFLAMVGGIVKLIIRPIVDASHAKNKEWLTDAIAAMKAGLTEAMTAHVESQNPHPEATDALHEPFRKADEELLREIRHVRRRLARLTNVHNEAMKMERRVAATISGKEREPRRSGDPPETDFAGLPALARLIVPDDVLDSDEEGSDGDAGDQP